MISLRSRFSKKGLIGIQSRPPVAVAPNLPSNCFPSHSLKLLATFGLIMLTLGL